MKKGGARREGKEAKAEGEEGGGEEKKKEEIIYNFKLPMHRLPTHPDLSFSSRHFTSISVRVSETDITWLELENMDIPLTVSDV